MRDAITYIGLLLCYAGTLHAQHKTSYSQFMFNGMLLNPAYAGSHEALNLTALYRNQWAGLSGAPKAVSFTAHTPLKNRKLNTALLFENESAGLFQHTQAQAAFAYRLPLDKIFLSFGIQAGVDAKAFDREALRIRHEDDPAFLQSSMRTNEFIAGSGVYLHSDRFYAGLAAPEITHLTAGRPTLIQFHSGSLIRISQDIQLKPSVLVRHLQNSPWFVSAAVTTYYKEIIGLGAAYSWRSSWFAYLDLKINAQLSFGYAHERSVGSISTYNGGTHEVMLRYLFRYRITAINPRYF